MGYFIANGLGDNVDEPSPEQVERFLEALDVTDEEHGAAWLSTDEGASLEWSGGGLLVFTSPRSAQTRHRTGVSRERAVELFVTLMREGLGPIERLDWSPGPRPPLDEAQIARLRDAQEQSDRRFYDSLGAERREPRCRASDCARGAIAMSVLCRVHHFESVTRRKCPFDD